MADEKMSLDEFRNKFTDSPYFDNNAYPKITKAFQALCDRIPYESMRQWPRILVFVPPSEVYGCALPLLTQHGDDDAFIYLAPCLEKQTQAQVNSTVAEEFAHAMLRHHVNPILTSEEAKAGYPNYPQEQAAKKQAVEWGFELPPGRKET